MSTPITTYQEWTAAGKPYQQGLALLNTVRGFAHLKKLLARGPNSYNKGKLDAMLKRYAKGGKPERVKRGARLTVEQEHIIRTLTELPPEKTGRGAVESTGTPEEESDESSSSNPTNEDAEDGGSDEAGDLPPAFATKQWVAIPFAELPDVLKRLRIGIIERQRRRTKLHRQLVAGIERKEERTLVCREIDTITNEVTRHYQLERDWKDTGALPTLSEDEEQALRKLDLFQLQRTLTNQVAPKISRLRSKLKRPDLTEEEHLQATMALSDAEHTKEIIDRLILEKDQQRKA